MADPSKEQYRRALNRALRALKHMEAGGGLGVIGHVGVSRVALSHIRDELGDEAYLALMDAIKGPADG